MVSVEQVMRGNQSDYKVVDLTHALEEGIPRYNPEFIPFGHIRWMDTALGDTTNAFGLYMHEHMGTHVDAPAHYPPNKDCEIWIDEIPLETFMGPLKVIDVTHKPNDTEIDSEDIRSWEKKNAAIQKGDVAIIKTGWFKKWEVRKPTGLGKAQWPHPYYKDFPGLNKDGAEYLVKRGIKLVGIDTGDIDTYTVLVHEYPPYNGPMNAHSVFLGNKIPLMEGIDNLDQVPPVGAYFIGLPMKIGHGSGAPIRALALVPK